MANFKELRVWQDGIELAVDIYKLSQEEPFSKDFALARQIQKASVSIASNVAEGDQRGTNKEAIYFFNVAKGSIAEVITQLIIAHRIGYIDQFALEKLELQAQKIAASLVRLIQARSR